MALCTIFCWGRKFVDEAIHENHESWAPTKYNHFTVTTPTLNIALVCKQDGITDKQTDKQTEDANTRCTQRTFQARGIKRCGCTQELIWDFLLMVRTL